MTLTLAGKCMPAQPAPDKAGCALPCFPRAWGVGSSEHMNKRKAGKLMQHVCVPADRDASL